MGKSFHPFRRRNRRPPVLPPACLREAWRVARQVREADRAANLGAVLGLATSFLVSLGKMSRRRCRTVGLGVVRGLPTTPPASPGRIRPHGCRTAHPGVPTVSNRLPMTTWLGRHRVLVEFQVGRIRPVVWRRAVVVQPRQRLRARLRLLRRQPAHPRLPLQLARRPAAHQVPRPARALDKAQASKPVNRDRGSRLRRTRSASCRRNHLQLPRTPSLSRLPSKRPRQARGRALRPPLLEQRQAPAAQVRHPCHKHRLAPQPLRQARRPARRRLRRWVRLRRRPRPHPSLSRVRVPAVRVAQVSRRCRPTSSRTPLRRRRSR